MKVIAALFLLIVSSVAALAQDQTRAASVVDTLGDAMTKSNMKIIEELLSDNATVYWVDKEIYGKPQILKFLRSQLSASEKHALSYSPDDGLEDESISTVWGTFAFNYGSGDQVSNQILGRYSAVTKKVAEGKWQVVSLHMSTSRGSG